MEIVYQPLNCALAVYHKPCASVVALANLRSSLSRSLELIAISVRKGKMSSAFHFERVRKRSAKRGAASIGRAEAGKYDNNSASLAEVR
jgi:hypothetical protein